MRVYYANMVIKRKSLLLTLRIIVTISAWIAVTVYAHSLAHTYEAELAHALSSPYAKLAAVVVFLTALIFFVSFSLPFFPNMGLRGVALTLLWSSLIVFGHSVSHEGFHEIEASLVGMQEEFGVTGFVVLSTVYALALAAPFVPGVEIGLLIIALLGATGALIAYLATVGGLSLAFAIGRFMPEQRVKNFLHRVGVDTGTDEIDASLRKLLEPKPGRIAIHHRFVASLLRYRHLTLGLALNFPGNSILGGGGGLALLGGVSKQFKWKGFLLTVVVATSPLPILVLSGVIDTQPLLEHHGVLHNLLMYLENISRH